MRLLIALVALTLAAGVALVDGPPSSAALGAVPSLPAANAGGGVSPAGHPGPAQDLVGVWSFQESGTSQTLRAVSFADRSNGWAVGGERDDECVILRTADGGETWGRQACPAGIKLETVDFVDADNGWAAGLNGFIIRTGDGGAHWWRQDSDVGDTVNAIEGLDGNIAYAALRGGDVLKTTDGGMRWRRTGTKNGDGLFDLHFLDANVGWAVGSAGTILRTLDGGQSWQRLPSGTDERLYAVEFVSLDLGWVAGNGIRHTNNGGGAWWDQARGGSMKSAEDLDMADAQSGWMVGDEGYIAATYDGGNHWTQEAAGLTTRGLRSVCFVDRQTGWAVGTGGMVLRYQALPPTPTRVPPTFTPTNTPTATPTVTPTATPTGPWLDAGPVEDSLMIARDAYLRLEVRYANIPLPARITGTLEGPVFFTAFGYPVSGGAAKEYSGNLLRGEGREQVIMRAEADATVGEPFRLDVQVGALSTTRQGLIAHSAWLPFAWRPR